MRTVEQIIEEIIRREGGYVDHPNDRGQSRPLPGPLHQYPFPRFIHEIRSTSLTSDTEGSARKEGERFAVEAREFGEFDHVQAALA